MSNVEPSCNHLITISKVSQITTLGGLNRFGFGKSNWAHCVIYSFAVFTSGLSSEHRRGVESWMANEYGALMTPVPFDVNIED